MTARRRERFMIRIRTARFKSFARIGVAGLLLTSTLAACDVPSKEEWGGKPKDEGVDAAEAGYLAPPRLEQASRASAGVLLTGMAAPRASVRLGSPTGEAITGQADAEGRWTLTVPPGEVRLYGLSMTRDGRTVQAEGYVMVTPEGAAATLRAGAGALRLAPPASAPQILAVDVDQEGGGVISGMASPGAGLGVRVDRTPRAVGVADETGRFVLSLSEPLSPGVHDIQVGGEGGEQRVALDVSPGPRLTDGPVRAVRLDNAWRVDWMTPAGGVQTTFLMLQAGR